MTDPEAVAAYLAAYCRGCGHGPHPGRPCIVVSVRPGEVDVLVPVDVGGNGYEQHPGCVVVTCECEEYGS